MPGPTEEPEPKSTLIRTWMEVLLAMGDSRPAGGPASKTAATFRCILLNTARRITEVHVMKIKPLWLSLGLAALLTAPAFASDPEDAEPLVYAAASLTDVLQTIGADFNRDRNRPVKFSFGSTATLARQLEAGAPADLFISADQEWMNYVAERKLINPQSRVNLLGNSLVMIAPSSAPAGTLELTASGIAAALGPSGRISLADPTSVPAGKYARAALTQLGLWEGVAQRFVASDNVRTALQFVARGEAPLGVVYETDARVDPRVRIVAKFPPASHPPIIYPAALTNRSGATAAMFLEYLTGPAARARFEAAGFRVLVDESTPAVACRVGNWDMSAEIGLFQGVARPLTAARRARAALPELSTGLLWELQLAPQNEVHFITAPSRSLIADGSFAGLARVSVPAPGRYRITIDGPFWVDLLNRGRPLAALDFGGRQGCGLFRKIIEYDIPDGAVLALQLSGAGRSVARITVSPSVRGQGPAIGP